MTYLTSAVMTAELISISEDRPALAAQDLMKANRIRHLPVVNKDNELAGIVSIKDFGKIRGKNKCVKDIMSTPVRVVSKSTNIQAVIETMLTDKISSLLVANEQSVMGIVTTEDLLKLLSQVLEDKEDLESFELSSFFDDSWCS